MHFIIRTEQILAFMSWTGECWHQNTHQAPSAGSDRGLQSRPKNDKKAISHAYQFFVMFHKDAQTFAVADSIKKICTK